MTRFPSRRTCDLLLAGAVLVILALTLATNSDSTTTVNLDLGVEIQRAFDSPSQAPMVNLVGNLALFVPIGFLVRFGHRWPVLVITVLGGAFSTAIELAQYVLGRAADIDDIVLNVTGTLLGSLAASLLLFALGRRGHARPPAGRPGRSRTTPS